MSVIVWWWQETNESSEKMFQLYNISGQSKTKNPNALAIALQHNSSK
jgi:hypothetical protein